MIVSETALFLYDISHELRTNFVAREAENPDTRSDEGQSDPLDGFWIGLWGKMPKPALARYTTVFRLNCAGVFARLRFLMSPALRLMGERPIAVTHVRG